MERGALKASIFLFDSGVAAVQLENGVSELTMLPFSGTADLVGNLWRQERHHEVDVQSAAANHRLRADVRRFPSPLRFDGYGRANGRG